MSSAEKENEKMSISCSTNSKKLCEQCYQAYCKKIGLQWICNAQIGFVKDGFVKHGYEKHRFVKHRFCTVFFCKIIIKNNIIIIIRTFPESFSPEKFILGNKFVNFKRSNLLRSRNMCTNHEIPLILNLVWWRHQSRDYAQKRLFSLLWKQIFIKSKKRNVVRSTLSLVI